MNLLSLLSRRKSNRPQRILWILTHKTLAPAEVPIIESFGFEVFVPSALSDDPGFISASGRHDQSGLLSAGALSELNSVKFEEQEWSPAISRLINSSFDAVVTAAYPTPLIQALTHFKGPVFVRAFGREGDLTYDQLFEHYGCVDLIKGAGDRFVFAQAYSGIKAIEPDYLVKRAVTIGCAIPGQIWSAWQTWARSRDDVLFICPRIGIAQYYREQYDKIVAAFGGLPRTILGAQAIPIADPTVIGYIEDAALFEQYRTAACLAYVSSEPRHIHYTPLEAIIVGMPVLYLGGSMLSLMAGEPLAGECSTLQDMADKARRIVEGDEVLISDIKARQNRLLHVFTDECVRREWGDALSRI